MSEIHLICNAHLDPVWQWDWEEGAAAAVSTFRAAADFCEEFDDFVFCHNEALLYRWIEEYEPQLFKRIQKLVKVGKWHIAGGWYLQPDCNMPGGESIIRQMQNGRAYFADKFGEINNTAVSFDAFGHNRGLVQLLKKAGYDSYLFMRPDPGQMHLPGNDFIWVGYDGSEVMAHRLATGYNSPLGEAREKIERWLEAHPDSELGLIPWGVGNHGGGASRKDIADLNALKAEHPEAGLLHSTPENFFKSLNNIRDTLPKVASSLNPFAVGCYTSQVRIKQTHRALESLLNETERMLSHAAMAGLIEYPADEILEASRDLCMSEFHDILPGSSIQPVEEYALQLMHHGLEIIGKLRARAFFALSAGQKKADTGSYPILVYNPYPYPVEQDIECEFMLADQNWKEEFTDFEVFSNGQKLPSQVEKERSNLPLDWRKRVVFHAMLQPMQMNRFDCKPNILDRKPVPQCAHTEEAYLFENARIKAEISRKTGLLTRYCVDGFDYLSGGALKLLVVKDSVDPWGMTVDRFSSVIDEFRLMTPQESAHFAGVFAETLPPVRVIEDGPVRTVIESCFRYADSSALITYRLPKDGAAVAIEVRLLYAEKDTMVKLSVPTVLADYIGQGMFGYGALHGDGREDVAQQWTAATDDTRMLGLLNNGLYGSNFIDGEIRVSLIRGAAYTAHPIHDRVILPQDRFSPRIDQGERIYRFVLEGGDKRERISSITREAQLFNEAPYALSFFPDGSGSLPACGAELTGAGVQMSAFRPAQDGNGYIVRLFETTGEARKARLSIPMLNINTELTLKPFEIKTLRADKAAGTLTETNLLD